jgi:hypothetical protein
MAKQKTRVLQARQSDASRDDDDSLLIRSAESLGRVVGSLQRQVQGSAKRMSTMADDPLDALSDLSTDVFAAGRGIIERGMRVRTIRGATASGARKASSVARKSSGARKRTAARKQAGARKAAGSRKTSAARKASRARKTARARTSARSKR